MPHVCAFAIALACSQLSGSRDSTSKQAFNTQTQLPPTPEVLLWLFLVHFALALLVFVFQKHQAYFKPVFLQGTFFTNNFHWFIFPNPPIYLLRDALPDCPIILGDPQRMPCIPF